MLLRIRARAAACALWVAFPTFALAEQQPYRLPPPIMQEVLEAERPARVTPSPDRAWVLVVHEPGMPGIEVLAAPRVTVARYDINPRTNGRSVVFPYEARGFDLLRASDAKLWPLEAPTGSLSLPLWSPDSKRFAFWRATASGMELWIGETATRLVRRLTAPELNTARGGGLFMPCAWMPDSARLLCQFVRADRGEVPQPAEKSTGPEVLQSGGNTASLQIYHTFLQDSHAQGLYDYYMTSQLEFVDAVTGQRKKWGSPGIYELVNPSPSGQYLLTVRIVRPYSGLYPDEQFPKEVEVHDLGRGTVQLIASLPLDQSGPVNVGWASAGPRRFAWRPDVPATLVYSEALDGGDPGRKAEFRDRIVMLEAPFTASPTMLFQSRFRLASYLHARPWWPPMGNLAWARDGVAWIEEYDAATHTKRIWLADANRIGTPARLVREFNVDDMERNPGAPIWINGGLSSSASQGRYEARLVQDADWVYLIGQPFPDGVRPFLDRLNLETLQTERLFTSGEETFEEPLAFIDARRIVILTRIESENRPPQLQFRDLSQRTQGPVMKEPPPPPELARISAKRVYYRRSDGVQLSGILRLPSEYRSGCRLPLIVNAYPLDFADAQTAERVMGSPHRYPWNKYPGLSRSVGLLATQGYAVLDDAAMPLVGGSKAYDTAAEQLLANARAAVDHVVAMGIADRERVGVIGQSFGGMMVAILLADSDLFTAGVATNGAYDFTTEPFGFQKEGRSFWEAPDVYRQLSPLLRADRIRAPLLLIHGEEDDHVSTGAEQGRRMFNALSGLGRQSRLVILPHEGHLPKALESNLHLARELLDWFDRFLKQGAGQARCPAAHETAEKIL